MSFLLPGVASLVVSLILLILGQSTSVIALAAAATFPAVYLVLTQQGGAGAGAVGKALSAGKGLLEEEEEKLARKLSKKLKKVEEAKKKLAQKLHLQEEKQQSNSTQSDENDEEEESSDAPSSSVEEKKGGGGLTKTAAKKAKKEAAKKAEEEKQKAEAEAKKKADEADKKKKKKAAKKEGFTSTTSGEAAESPVAGGKATTGAPAQRGGESAKEEGGWEVQKSDKPSSSKAAGSNKAKAATTTSVKGNKTDGNKGASGGEGESKESTSSSSSGPDAYEELYIPFKFHAQLIGSKGATLQQLQSTGCKIDMPKKDSGSTKVQLTGSADAVKSAKAAIESLTTKGYSTITHPGWVHDDVNVDEKHFGLIIGPQGKYIQAIQQKTSTRINLPEKDSGSHRVVIVGKKEDVRSARLAIKELIADGFSPLTHDNFVKKEVHFPKDKLHVLIGAKGQTIKSIQGNSKAKINIPDRGTGPAGESDVRITVVGTPEAVAQAEKEISRLLIPVQVVEEEAEEEYRDGTWGQSGPTEDELWE